MADTSSSATAAPQRILVALATGKQGSAVVRALAAHNSAEHTRFAVLGCTRDASSAKASALAALPGVTLLETPYDAAALFAKAQQHGQRLDGVFSVQLSADTTFEAEVALGCAMADEAAKAHVGLFVYASVQRGDVDKTDIVHFESKRAIEQYIADKHPTLPCAILRPVFFADNLGDYGYSSKLFAAALNACVKRPLQLVACRDIGIVAAKAFAAPQEWHGKTLALAGDELSVKEMAEQFKRVKGTALPSTNSFLGLALVKSVAPLRTMFNFFNDPGFSADIAKCKEVHPEMWTWREYVEHAW
ncbi:NAD(P)-binding protein [Tilletiopsis washingtonensis]|uniref:NAD(P)-binding protein n=1 Tax=Tilletiopsis washingtonensis TaxID=58919 RepID=A0A316ZBC3_9BASI|nr:NAD(P)-binding protein [Tilletiopsis washingtonensis]PWN97503.1 NAD(P)-binding protein [Tilletiopsis washingtonensis]